MMDVLSWISFDTWDIIVLTGIFAIGIYLYFFRYSNDSSSKSTPKFTPLPNTAISRQRDTSFISRMKQEGRQVLILFGSQTGTAEELAGRLSKDLVRYGKKALVLDPEEMEVEDLSKITELTDPLLILCMATYGEGDPTDNAQALHEYLTNNDIDLNGLKYTVFGLGNKTYEHYNAIGKFFDHRLEELGAQRIFEIGLGDDDANLEEDFMRWREAFLPSLTQAFGWEISNESGLERQYRFELITEPGNVFKGEFSRIGAYERQRPPFDQKNPFLATILVNRELHADKSERNCRHIEFDIEGSRIRYDAGDHLGVFPTNDSALVEKLGNLLNADLDQVFKLINLDEESSKRHPFPCPTSFRTALTHYVDICAPIKSHVLKAISEYASDEVHKQRLLLLSTASEEGLKEYSSFIQKERRSIVDVLTFFDSCKPPIEFLLELLPRLQARYYSISSSSKPNANVVAITAVVTRYNIGNRLIKGVCTNFLLPMESGSKCPVFVRKSTLRLPHRLNTPVIMIGPGTGYAPFRGFLQEREWHKSQGKEISEMALFFGCRHPDHDYIYKEELEHLQAEGVLTHLHLAFSRLTEKKVYVQNKLWEEREHIWSLMQQGAHMYICGDARNMARDVQNTFQRIFKEVGEMSEEAAQKFFKDLERQRRYQADVWS